MAEKLMFSGVRTELAKLALAASLGPLAGCGDQAVSEPVPLNAQQRLDCDQEGIDGANAILAGRKRFEGTPFFEKHFTRSNVTDRQLYDALKPMGAAACEVDARNPNNPASLIRAERDACRKESLARAENTLINRVSQEGPGFLQQQFPPEGTPTQRDMFLREQQRTHAECIADEKARKTQEHNKAKATKFPAYGTAGQAGASGSSAQPDIRESPRVIPQFVPQASTEILKHESFGDADFEVLSKLIMLESSGGKNTANPLNPKVKGIYQFSEGTALRFGLKDRADPFESLVAAGKLEVHNRKSLIELLGHKPSKFEVAFAHQQGAVGAAALINNPKKNAIDVLTPIYKSKAVATQAIINNSGDASMTSEDFIAVHMGKYNMADANQGLEAINGILASKGLETIDAKFTNPFGTKLDKTPYGSLFVALMGKPKTIGESRTAEALGGFVEKLMKGTPTEQRR